MKSLCAVVVQVVSVCTININLAMAEKSRPLRCRRGARVHIANKLLLNQYAAAMYNTMYASCTFFFFLILQLDINGMQRKDRAPFASLAFNNQYLCVGYMRIYKRHPL